MVRELEWVGDAVTALGEGVWMALGEDAPLGLEEAATQAVEGLILGFEVEDCVRMVAEAGGGATVVSALRRVSEALRSARAESALMARSV